MSVLLDALRVVLPNVLAALNATALAIPAALLLATAALEEEGEAANEVAQRANALLLTTEACALCARRGTRTDLFMAASRGRDIEGVATTFDSSSPLGKVIEGGGEVEAIEWTTWGRAS